MKINEYKSCVLEIARNKTSKKWSVVGEPMTYNRAVAKLDELKARGLAKRYRIRDLLNGQTYYVVSKS